MLKILFGAIDNVAYGPRWFNHSYEIIWFDDTFVQEMVAKIDGTRYVGGYIFDSPTLGPISPEKLSGGLKTLVMIYERTDRIFDATSCGPNCTPLLLEIGRRRDVTVNLRYCMPMDGLEPLDIEIINAGITVHRAKEYTNLALKFLTHPGKDAY
ncbi:MAG: DUF4869 domain-containing protein [Succinivibrionaceae bacterium]|nr:DUF4869 domain-containing protein [Succinivibrionaceae bacterium]